MRYTKPLKPFVNAIKPGLTAMLSTVVDIGCLIESLHSSGKEPMLIIFESIKDIMKKIIKDGMT